jgi:ATP-dependent Clp protease ATP-binding subunit ClpB
MTSNLGSQWLLSGAETDEGMEEKVLATVRDHFKPEFLNRLDEIIVFHRLAPAHLERIVDIQLESLARRLADRHVGIVTTAAAKEYLAAKGYEPAYGARPLKRLIQREIENPLALGLLEGKFADGDTIQIDAGDDGLEFRKDEATAA